MKSNKKKKAFTLIELVIVIAIIAILAAIAIPRYQKSKNKADEVAKKSNISMLATAAALRQADLGENKTVIWSDDKNTNNNEDYNEYVDQWPKGKDTYQVKITKEKIEIYINGDLDYDSEAGGIISKNKIKAIK